MQARRIIAIALGLGAVAAAGAVALEKTGNLPEALRAEADRAEAPQITFADITPPPAEAQPAEAGSVPAAEPEIAGAADAEADDDADMVVAGTADAADPAQSSRATDPEPITEASGETAGFLTRLGAMFTSRGEDRAEARSEAQPRVLRGGGGGRWQSARDNE